MNMYQKLINQCKEFPMVGKDEVNNTVLVVKGENENGKYVKTETAQKNNWIRINYYYENGDTEELFDK